MEDNASFCSKCGGSLHLPKAPEGSIYSNSTPVFSHAASAGLWMRYLIPALLLVAVATGAAYIYKPEFLGFSGPEETIFKFVKAYNEKDVNVMLTCFDSRVERGVNGVGNIIGGLFGVNPHELFNVFPLLSGIIGNQPGNSQFENVKIVQKSRSVDAASITATMDERKTLAQGEQIYNLRIQFELKREDSNWRIMAMKTIQ